jgi:hypothetical protein
MRTLWKRLVCLFTLNHIDPGVRTEGDRLRCKKCGADVGGVWS